MDNLKPCPLCGCEAKESIEFYAFELDMSISCTCCGCTLNKKLSTEKAFTSKKRIIEFLENVETQWNNRTEMR